MEGLKELHECLETTSTILQRVRGACDDGSDYAYMCTPDSSKRFCRAGWMIRNGLYVLQILPFLQEFRTEQLLFIRSEDFYDNTTTTMDDVTQFLGLDSIDWDDIVGNTFNILPNSSPGANLLSMGISPNSHYPPMDISTRKLLNEFYSPFNAALQNVVSFSWDNKP